MRNKTPLEKNMKFVFFIQILLFSIAIGCMSCSPILKKGPIHSKNVSQGSKIGSPGYFQKADIYFQILPVDQKLISNRDSTLKITFWKDRSLGIKEFGLTDELEPYVWLWMPMPSGSHGTSPVSTSQDLENGQIKLGFYTITEAYFSMPGEWEVHIDLKQKDGKIVDAAVQTIEIE